MSRLAAFLRPLLAVLLVLATQFQAGSMPARTGDGVVMVICSGEGPMMMVLDPATGEFHPAPATTKKSGCDWASCGALALEVRAEMPVPLPRTLGLSPQTAAMAWRPAHDPRGIWARGPPRLV